MSIQIEPEPLPRRFKQLEVSPHAVCEECKKNGSEVFFHKVQPYDVHPNRMRRNAVVCVGRCPKGHEAVQKIERVGVQKKVVSKQ